MAKDDADPCTRPEPRVDSTLSKGLQILETLAMGGKARGVTDLSRDLDLTKSNIFRLLQTLSALGYVRQDDKGLYYATLKTWQVGRSALDHLNLRALAAAEMAYLAGETGETIYLAVPDTNRVIYIDKIDSRKAIRSWNPVGGEAPMHCVGTGKAILACNWDTYRRRLPDPLPGYTNLTRTTVKDLEQDLMEALRNGFAFDRGEFRERILSYGTALLRPSDGRAVGALGISLPDINLPEGGHERFGSLLVHAAASVSRKIESV